MAEKGLAILLGGMKKPDKEKEESSKPEEAKEDSGDDAESLELVKGSMSKAGFDPAKAEAFIDLFEACRQHCDDDSY